jgi:hypothetical protein
MTRAAEESLQKAKASMKRQWEKNRPTPQAFQEGDQVLVMAQHLLSNRPASKLDQKWRGPFQVVRKVGEATYELDLPLAWKGQRVFNEGRIKAFHIPTFPNQEELPSRPELELNNQGKEEYEVREILGQRGTGSKAEYLVRWEGYGLEDNAWEPQENLGNTKGALRAFRAQGQATKGGEYHVTASITEEIKRKKPSADKPSTDKPSLDGMTSRTSHRTMTQEKWDSGTRSVSHTGQSDLMGKLCRRVMVLIRWKVGANVAVMEHVVRALEEWLHRQGISIYTDLF